MCFWSKYKTNSFMKLFFVFYFIVNLVPPSAAFLRDVTV